MIPSLYCKPLTHWGHITIHFPWHSFTVLTHRVAICNFFLRLLHSHMRSKSYSLSLTFIYSLIGPHSSNLFITLIHAHGVTFLYPFLDIRSLTHRVTILKPFHHIHPLTHWVTFLYHVLDIHPLSHGVTFLYPSIT